MEIAILTSSRADFGFYKPLLNLYKKKTKKYYNLIVLEHTYLMIMATL